MAEKKESIGRYSGGDAVSLLEDAIASVKANADEKTGLTPQQKRAIEKMQTAKQMLTGTQTKPKPQRL